MNEKIQQVLGDQEFLKELLALDSAEAVQAKLAEKDIKLSLDEVNLIQKKVLAQLDSGSAELSEDDLESVAGGVATEVVLGVAGLVVAVAAAVPSIVDSIKTHRW